MDHNYGDVSGVQAHINQLGIECVIPGCTDVSLETCVQLSSNVQLLDDAETNSWLSNKARFRALCDQLDLPAPRVVNSVSFPREGRYICKPVDSYSGRGISVFDGADMLAQAAAIAQARAASRCGESLIETYVGNALYSCSGFLKDQRFTDVFFVKEGSSTNPYAVDTSFVVDNFPSKHGERLKGALERLAAHLRLKNGLLHTQFILSAQGPMIVEVSRRCPGDLYPLLIEYSTGFRYGAKYAASLAGYELEANNPAKRYILRHTVTADYNVEYGGIVFTHNSPILAFYPITCMGEMLLARQGNRAGILFSEYCSQSGLEDAYNLFLRRDRYSVLGALPH
ncbi:hypothetical protein [Microvirga arabica]|uniref:hypothetical protein n=1 Tax=Microvirga arabica TaxID=1128671 RepID=UPI00193A5AF2|nr:hypothetical protein [Microvirga arabica]MBM1173051.1 hypothetical protein [Microvirga arabica]